MKTTIFVLLLAVVLSACAPAVALTPTATSIPPTATAIPSTATAKPTVTATDIPETSGDIQANGRSLYLKCQGTGSPTIVLEANEGSTVSPMRKLQETLAGLTTTCAYDRANIGRSGSAPTPRTAKDVVDDLHALLAAAKVPGPYLLVGNAAGAQFVQLYARLFPDQVVGVVAMDPWPPERQYLDEVSKVFTAQEYASEKKSGEGENVESMDYVTSSDQLAAAPPPPAVPFEMLFSTDVACQEDPICVKSQPAYEKIMHAVAAAWPRGTISQVVVTHDIYGDNPDAVVAAVKRVLSKP